MSFLLRCKIKRKVKKKIKIAHVFMWATLIRKLNIFSVSFKSAPSPSYLKKENEKVNNDKKYN